MFYPETSERNKPYSLRYSPEERSSQRCTYIFKDYVSFFITLGRLKQRIYFIPSNFGKF